MQAALNKVSFPLKWKIILSNVGLLLITVVLLVNFASRLFTEDKSATVYEATLNSSLSLGERFDQFLKKSTSSFSLLYQFSKKEQLSENSLKSVFAQNPDLMSYSYWTKNKKKLKLRVYLENELSLKQNELDQKFFLELDRAKKNQLKSGLHVEGLESGLMRLVYVKESKEGLALARFSLDEPLKELNESTQYRNFIVLNDKVLSSSRRREEGSQKDMKKTILELARATDGPSSRVVKLEVGSKTFLTGVTPLEKKGLALSLVEESILFKASAFLRKQSLFFSLFIFSITVIIGVLLSRRMTNDLHRLHEASVAFSQGKFEENLSVRSRDEIGSLAKTFTQMGQDILSYIEEMKDKARLEKEMEVAKLVQESFIPQESITQKNVAFSSFYKAASECGGDWWGYFVKGPWLTLVVADATGHGVPAALLTATASGCLHNIEYRLDESSQNFIKPDEVLRLMNHAITKMGGKIHMTGFALVLNTATGEGFYSQASHNPPLFMKEALKEGKVVDKGDLVPLMEENGPRLGESLSSSFKSVKLQLNPGDFLLLYSDGLVEQTNKDGKQWGNRKFYKSLVEGLNLSKGPASLELIPQKVIADLKEFSETESWDDDTTLLALGFFNDGELEAIKMEPVSNPEDIHEVLSHQGNDFIYGELLKKHPLRHVMRQEEERKLIEEIQAEGLSFQKLDFDVEKEISLKINKSQEVDQKVEEALKELDYSDYFDSPVQYLGILAKELASNALYHQQEHTTSADRREGVELSEGQSVICQLVQAPKGIAVKVEDRSGRLHYDEFRKSLTRAFESKTPADKDGGAGLGLYMVFQNANSVFVEVEKNVRTTVIAVIEKERRYKKYKEKTTTFHYFEKS